ncbi:hypothetical protein LCGC14_0660450 [marine sediment metagenome]|uniref:Uncharacterized protein n=1 Tax=marine sediment metagenome TaxID=412755 RepID=A0A0F9RDT5_9ZZZZ
MPDLPELYEALDDALRYFLVYLYTANAETQPTPHTEYVSALCAAIEVKQTQELNEFMNRGRYSEAGVRVIEAVQLYYDWVEKYDELPVRLQQVLDAYKDFREEETPTSEAAESSEEA